MLHTMIKRLNSHLPRGRSLPGRAENTTPSLPPEIWWVIFETALYSSLTMLDTFVPCDIVLAHGYFLGGLDMQAVIRHLTVTLRKSLRQVCKAWKHIIDNIRIDYRQIQPHKTRHNARTLIKSWSDNGAAAPKQLGALILRRSKISMDILKDFLKTSIPLTTLSLHLTDALILQTCLTIPTVVNLFVSIASSREEQERIWTDPSRYRWKLPALHNLSLSQRKSDLSDQIISSHPFYIELLKQHKHNLRSLLMDPMTKQVHSRASPVWWVKMPKLQVLATNFCCYFFRISPGRIILPWNSKSTSVRHLIHFDDGRFAVVSMGFFLARCIRSCTRLESVTVVNRGTAVKRMTVNPVEVMTRLRDLCIKRDIPIWSQSDVLKPKKIVTFGPR
ncbi:hypothetical protein CPB86DRAFT_820876 [Serendipita vermifera]|nr:hypothetical protein CPB86DRAFT_820876 [Serendipita vermifera]